MKKTRRNLLTAFGLALGIASSMSLPVYAGEWQKNDIGWWYQNDDMTYPTTWAQIGENWYLFNSDGYMQTEGNWEGGFLNEDGSLSIDYINLDYGGGSLVYERSPQLPVRPTAEYLDADIGFYAGTIGWKQELSNKIDQALGGIDDYGTYSVDMVLPANWREEMPDPLLNSLINNHCFDNWGGWGNDNWSCSWVVNDDNLLHAEMTHFYVEGLEF